MLPKPSQQFPEWQPCTQAGAGVALPLQMPFWQGWAGMHGQGLLPGSGSVASATIRFFPPHTNLMAMLHFSQKELRKAFLGFSEISRSVRSNRRSQSDKVQKAFLLYAIYAAECGLKYILLVKRRLNSTKDFGQEIPLDHNLNSLLEKSEILDRSSKLFQRMQRNNRENIPSKRLHELYRYGGQLDTRSEENLIKDLSNLLIKIKDKVDQLAERQYQ